jgi:hypothetical protein
MARRVFLTGAPDASTLDWDSSDLNSEFDTVIAEYLDPNASRAPTRQVLDQPAWRRLPLQKEHLPTGLSQKIILTPYDPDVSSWRPKHQDDFTETSFLDTTFLSITSSNSVSIPSGANSEVLSQFYDHSYAIHKDLAPSQGSSCVDESFTTDSSEIDSTTSTVTQAPSLAFLQNHNPLTPIIDLSSIPPAGYLFKIQPQTMTVNLIVGLISVSPARTITVKRTRREVELIELLVGDETKAGFKVTFWLDPVSANTEHANSNKARSTRETLSMVRSQDVLLLSNVALSSFRGSVFGQSLRRGLTGVDLLYRTNRVDRSDDRYRPNLGYMEDATNASNSHLKKTRDVIDWVLKFVGSTIITDRNIYNHVATAKTGLLIGIQENLPPDTP